jgi:hypothetical protein
MTRDASRVVSCKKLIHDYYPALLSGVSNHSDHLLKCPEPLSEVRASFISAERDTHRPVRGSPRRARIAVDGIFAVSRG